jgi:mono/diheme cytochrome c family protein
MTAQASQGAKPASNGNRIARGKYVVEGVAICGMCHTPRTDSGEVDNARALDGAAVWLLPAHPSGNWPLKAPRIAGTPPASDDDMVRLLMTGVWTDGNRLRPPMPQFRMSREDAEAVVAYLRSLTSRSGD